jgi:hypothetical protein
VSLGRAALRTGSGREMSTSEYTKAEEVEMRDRRAGGETYRQIADAMGKSYHKVWHWFRAEPQFETKPATSAEGARRRMAVAARRFQPARDQQSNDKIVLPKDAFR